MSFVAVSRSRAAPQPRAEDLAPHCVRDDRAIARRGSEHRQSQCDHLARGRARAASADAPRPGESRPGARAPASRRATEHGGLPSRRRELPGNAT